MRSIIFFALTLILPAAAFSDFAIRNGDVIAFLGDSNSEAGGYTKVVENYLRMRYPKYKLTFINAGISGDTAINALARLERDVFPPKDENGKEHDWLKFPNKGPKATVVIVILGINDINWGKDMDPKTIQTYHDSLAEIVKKSEAQGARVLISSYPVIGEDPELPVNAALESIAKKAMALSSGGVGIDALKYTKEILKNVIEYNKSVAEGKKLSLHIADGVHFNDLGHQAVGYALLKGMGVPQQVSKTSFKIMGKLVNLTDSQGGKVTQYSYLSNTLKFERLDDGLPLTMGLAVKDDSRKVIPFSDDLAQYIIQVNGLRPGRYLIYANGMPLSRTNVGVTAAELEVGVNVTKLIYNVWIPNGPWGSKSLSLSYLTDSRLNFRNSSLQSFYYLSKEPNYPQIMENLEKIKQSLSEIQDLVVKPEPIRFTIQQLD